MSTAEGFKGGAGGKLRTRQPGRTPAKPYDRPPAVARGLRGSRVNDATEAGRRRSGWMLKLVDLASSLIAKGATRLFSSVFRKQFGSLPLAESLGYCCKLVSIHVYFSCHHVILLSPVVPSSPGNDQMNVEDSMADDTLHAAGTRVMPAFVKPSNVPAASLPFGSPSTPSGAPVFQFAAACQPLAFPQSQTLFQVTGSFEFGGNFSVGSVGGGMSGPENDQS